MIEVDESAYESLTAENKRLKEEIKALIDRINTADLNNKFAALIIQKLQEIVNPVIYNEIISLCTEEVNQALQASDQESV